MPIQKVLVVDDSPTERYFLTDILVKNGFSVSTAENGEEALLKVKADKPQLILMDVVMPGQNGFQITRAISRDPETQDAWRKRGAMVPENVRPAEYRHQIQQRIQFYRNIVKTHKIVLE